MNASEEERDSPTRRALVNREGESPLVDAKEAARLCSISESMLYKLNAAGKIPAPVRIGSLLRWKRRELLEWIEAGCPCIRNR